MFRCRTSMCHVVEQGLRTSESDHVVEQGLRTSESGHVVEQGLRTSESDHVVEQGLRTSESEGYRGTGTKQNRIINTEHYKILSIGFVFVVCITLKFDLNFNATKSKYMAFTPNNYILSVSHIFINELP